MDIGDVGKCRMFHIETKIIRYLFDFYAILKNILTWQQPALWWEETGAVPGENRTIIRRVEITMNVRDRWEILTGTYYVNQKQTYLDSLLAASFLEVAAFLQHTKQQTFTFSIKE